MRVAVVTGANRGIGFEIVRGLVRAGLDGDVQPAIPSRPRFDVVYLTSRNEERGLAAVNQLDNERVKFHQLDITDIRSVVTFRDYLVEKYGEIDVLVQNAAIAGKKGNIKTEDVSYSHPTIPGTYRQR